MHVATTTNSTLFDKKITTAWRQHFGQAQPVSLVDGVLTVEVNENSHVWITGRLSQVVERAVKSANVQVEWAVREAV